MSTETLVFISHIHEEAALGAVVKEWIEDAFIGDGVRAFSSSDRGDLPPATRWLEHIEATLKSSRVIISLISPLAIERPWINIEVGAAWMLGLPVIPLYHSGLRDLPRPFQDFQGVDLGSTDAAKHLMEGLARALGLDYPKLALDEFRPAMLAAVTRVGSGNRWGVTISSPSKDEVVPRTLTVRGTILEPLPPGYTLRVLRSHPNSGGVAPSARANIREREWEALGVDIGGNPGEPRGIEAWVVGPDGSALLSSWEESANVHYEVNEQLKKATRSWGKWLPYIHETTRDMVRCDRVIVRRAR